MKIVARGVGVPGVGHGDLPRLLTRVMREAFRVEHV